MKPHRILLASLALFGCETDIVVRDARNNTRDRQDEVWQGQDPSVETVAALGVSSATAPIERQQTVGDVVAATDGYIAAYLRYGIGASAGLVTLARLDSYGALIGTPLVLEPSSAPPRLAVTDETLAVLSQDPDTLRLRVRRMDLELNAIDAEATTLLSDDHIHCEPDLVGHDGEFFVAFASPEAEQVHSCVNYTLMPVALRAMTFAATGPLAPTVIPTPAVVDGVMYATPKVARHAGGALLAWTELEGDFPFSSRVHALRYPSDLASVDVEASFALRDSAYNQSSLALLARDGDFVAAFGEALDAAGSAAQLVFVTVGEASVSAPSYHSFTTAPFEISGLRLLPAADYLVASLVARTGGKLLLRFDADDLGNAASALVAPSVAGATPFDPQLVVTTAPDGDEALALFADAESDVRARRYELTTMSSLGDDEVRFGDVPAWHKNPFVVAAGNRMVTGVIEVRYDSERNVEQVLRLEAFDLASREKIPGEGGELLVPSWYDVRVYPGDDEFMLLAFGASGRTLARVPYPFDELYELSALPVAGGISGMAGKAGQHCIVVSTQDQYGFSLLSLAAGDETATLSDSLDIDYAAPSIIATPGGYLLAWSLNEETGTRFFTLPISDDCVASGAPKETFIGTTYLSWPRLVWTGGSFMLVTERGWTPTLIGGLRVDADGSFLDDELLLLSTDEPNTDVLGVASSSFGALVLAGSYGAEAPLRALHVQADGEAGVQVEAFIAEATPQRFEVFAAPTPDGAFLISALRAAESHLIERGYLLLAHVAEVVAE